MTLMDDALASVDKVALVKRELPIAFILSYVGLQPAQVGDRVQCSCPFHQDQNPSFDVWLEADGTERWGCWPCGKRGDVIDLVQHFWPAGFGATIENCMTLRDACKQSRWRGPQPELPKNEWDEDAMLRLLWQAQTKFDTDGVQVLIDAKGWQLRPLDIRSYKCGTHEGRLLIPYFTRDGVLVAMKHRSLRGDDKPISFAGSRLRDVLFLEDRGRGNSPVVVVVEGESDAWAAYRATFGWDVEILGLPSGAGTPVQPFITRFLGRRVFLAFDGDEAGWAGEQRWLKAINDAGGCVRSLGVPDGEDICSLGPTAFQSLVQAAVN